MAEDRPEADGAPNGNLVIESLGVYLPSGVLTTEEVVRGCRRPLPFSVERLTGISARRVAADGEFSIDLARKAVEDCLARSRYGPRDVDLLICCSISCLDGRNNRATWEPSAAFLLKEQLGFEHAQAFDVLNACAGLFTGIYLVDALLRTGAIRRAIVASGEYITHILRNAQKEIEGLLDAQFASLTLGDAGAALLLERGADPGVGLHALELYTLGRYSSYCIAHATEREHGGWIMLTDPIRLSAVLVKHAVRHSVHLLRRSERPPDAFEHVIAHQTSQTTINDAMRQMNRLVGWEVCHSSNMVSNVAERGNTASTTHAVALADQIRRGRIKSGDRVVFSITASGATAGTALYTLDDLPERRRQEPNGRPTSVSASPRPRVPVSHPPVRRLTVTARIESLGTVPGGAAIGATALELARTAAERCLASSSLDRDAIELLLYTGVYRDAYLREPAMAALLAGELGLNDAAEPEQPKKTLAFDVWNGGIGFLNACHLALELIRAGKCSAAMVATAEIENNPPGSELRRGLVETGSAVILERSAGGPGFGMILFRSFGRYLDANRTYVEHEGGRMVARFIRDPRLEEHYLECIAETVDELLTNEGLDRSQLRPVLPPQISSGFVARLSDRLGLGRGSVIDLAGPGDYFTSSLAYSLERAVELGLAAPGEVGLLIEVGSGIQVGCGLYYF